MRESRESEQVHTSTLREAIYQMVHRSVIPAKAQAEFLGVSESFLYNAANTNLEDFRYPARHVVPHTTCTQNLALIRYFNEQVGIVGFRIPTGMAQPHDLRQGVLKIAKELGEAADSLERGLKDAQLTEPERARVRKELLDLMEAGAALYARLGGTAGVIR